MHKVSRSLLFASILALGGLAACGDDITVTDPPVQSATVTVAPNPASVAVGGTVNLVANINGGAAGEAITGWTSSNTSIATVSNTGVVTGVAAGDVAITATSTSGATGSATVRVQGGSQADVASVSISSITKGGLQNPVQLNNVFGQIDVTLNVDPGGQNVERVELVVIDSVTGAQTVVASQAITANPSVASGIEGLALAIAQANAQAAAMVAANVPQQITLSFNTAAFNPETGAVSFINGRKLIRARLILGAGSSQDQVASNSISVLFNNTDGFYVVRTPLNSIADRPQPNSAVDNSSLIWYQAGNGIQVRSVPVMYSGRTVQTRTLQYDGVQKTVTGGGVRTDTLSLISNPPSAGVAVWRDVVKVTAAVSGDGNQITLVPTGTINGQVVGSNSNETIGVRNDSLRIDNNAPTFFFSINESNPDNWVNSAYAFLQTMNLRAADSVTALTNAADPGVGLSGSFPFGASFQYAGCGTATYTTGTTFTGADIPECATDLTNSAYTGRVILRDRLGNSRTSAVRTFGVDKTAPQIAYLTPAQEPQIVRTTGDSVFHPTAATYPGVTSANAVFGVRYTDERSGFDVDAGEEPQFRRILRLAPDGDNCALGTATCGYARVMGAVESTEAGADPRFRRNTVNIFGLGTDETATSPGYYTYETYVVDRAGNQSPVITKRAAIDVTAPNITGITVPAILTGGQPATFTPTGTDDLEVIGGDLAIHYTDMNFGGGDAWIRWRRQMFPLYDAPWNATLATPVGPGAPFGSAGLTIPGGFITRLETVDAVTGAPQLAYANSVRNADSVGARLFDIKRYSTWAPADSATAYAASVSSFLQAPIFVGNLVVSTDSIFAARPMNTTRVHQFYIDTVTSNSVRVTAVGPTVAVNPPFTRIEIVRQDGTSNFYDVVAGSFGAPVPNDQGVNRFYTWTFTMSTTGAGEGQAPFADGQVIRAIGVDAAGNGLSTPDMTVGGVVPPPAPGV